ncbi:hypothetical protein DFH28DRAFT_1028470 [Melampsora americana]|nr:hypothetical protein DFH28DRAFT_1028470 [Melampsora americana]
MAFLPSRSASLMSIDINMAIPNSMDLSDLFADDMDIEVDDPSPNETSLQLSGSATSFAGTPQTNPSTLFRPPAPRSTPASATSRPSASRACVKKFADLLKLSKENQETLQQLYSHTLPGEEYIGTLAAIIHAFQEGNGSSTAKWLPGRVIRDTFKEQVAEYLLRPDLEAFSKTVADDRTTMSNSLEILTFRRQNHVQSLSEGFVNDYCPSDYVANEAVIPGTAMFLFIKETLKNQRSKVRGVLLTNILGVPEDSVAIVPAAKSMVLSVARVMLPYARALADDNLLKKLGREKIKWIIFMRYITVWYHLNHTVNKKRCQWTIMDEALADLRGRPASDRTTYFDRVVRYDREAFNGKQSWPTIKAERSLPNPVVDSVLAPVIPGESSSSGDLGTEEGGEEED